MEWNIGNQITMFTMFPRFLVVSMTGVTLTACNPAVGTALEEDLAAEPGESSAQIHEGYCETAPQYEVDGNLKGRK